MGQLIHLSERRQARAPQPAALSERPLFFFDVACPLSYLVSERVERKLGSVDWVAASRAALRHTEVRGHRTPGVLALPDPGPDPGALPGPDPGPDPGPLPGPDPGALPGSGDDLTLRRRAEAAAGALRLPLVWPDRFPSAVPCAQRAAAFACEIGAGAAFALAASRLAFCGGFDLEDPETLAEAAAAAGVPLEECLSAAGESWRDEELAATAHELIRHGVDDLPAIRVDDHWFQGEAGLLGAEAFVLGSGSLRRTPMPPV